MVTLINLKLNCRLTPNLYFATIQPDILLLSQTFNNCSNLNQFYLIFRRPKSRRSFHPSNTTAVNSDIFLETRNIFHNKSRNLKNHDIFSNWESTLRGQWFSVVDVILWNWITNVVYTHWARISVELNLRDDFVNFYKQFIYNQHLKYTWIHSFEVFFDTLKVFQTIKTNLEAKIP